MQRAKDSEFARIPLRPGFCIVGTHASGQTILRRFLIFLAWLITASPGLADPAESISAFRRSHGLSSVKADPILTRLAHEQAQAMADSGNMDHNVNGSFGSRISRYPSNHAAENIAMGNATFPATLKQWEDSSGHRANLLLKDVSRIGIASAGTGHRTYWSLILAAAPSAPPVKRRLAAAPSAAPTTKHSAVRQKGIFDDFILKLPFSLKPSSSRSDERTVSRTRLDNRP